MRTVFPNKKVVSLEDNVRETLLFFTLGLFRPQELSLLGVHHVMRYFLPFLNRVDDEKK